MISCPITIPKGRTTKDQIQIYLQQGYSKIWEEKKVERLRIMKIILKTLR